VSCILCGSDHDSVFYQDKLRQYSRCHDCQFIFVPRTQLLSSEAEKSRYDLHENFSDDENYNKYLSSVASAISCKIEPGGVGLDYGCGASTLLADLLKTPEREVFSYDLYFHPTKKIFTHKYDFIILCEVIEHLRDPLNELTKIRNLLKPNGRIFIKTKFFEMDLDKFSNWFYKNDPTHIQFFNESSIMTLKKLLRLSYFEKLESKDLYLIGD